MAVLLNFINDSEAADGANVVIFQKNLAAGVETFAVAWLVIGDCGWGDSRPFSLPAEMTVNASDSWGNHTPQIPAHDGQLFAMTESAGGQAFGYAGPATNPAQVQVRNDLRKGAINANLYRDRRLLAVKTSLAPHQRAAFQFRPTLWIGVVSQVVQGEVMGPAALSAIDTELSVVGVASADIVMSGGGQGRHAEPYRFALENVVPA
jgi:hypothetical protein